MSETDSIDDLISELDTRVKTAHNTNDLGKCRWTSNQKLNASYWGQKFETVDGQGEIEYKFESLGLIPGQLWPLQQAFKGWSGQRAKYKKRNC